MEHALQYETLYDTRGGRQGKKNKVTASRNGKYHQPQKYPDKRHSRVRKNIDFPKEMTKAYFRLSKELDRIQKIQQEELSWLCELYDMYLEDQEKEMKERGEDNWVI